MSVSNKEAPEKPLWSIPVVNGDTNQGASTTNIPSNVVVTNGTDKNPIICERCPCDTEGNLNCYFVFESECTESEVGADDTWSIPIKKDILCMTKPAIVNNWFVVEKHIARLYIPATMETLPDTYHDLPWGDLADDEGNITGINPKDPVSCDIDNGICANLEVSALSPPESDMIKPPEFKKCCQGIYYSVSLTELKYSMDKIEIEGGDKSHSYRKYEEWKKEDAIKIASLSNDEWHFCEATIKGGVRGCLVARIIFPSYCECDNVNYFDYKIAVGTGAKPSRINAGTVSADNYDEKEYGDVDSEVIYVPPSCTMEVLLYASDDDIGLASGTNQNNSTDLLGANQHRAYIGAGITIDWCPYMYYIEAYSMCKKGANIMLPGECEGVSIEIGHTLRKSYNDKVYVYELDAFDSLLRRDSKALKWTARQPNAEYKRMKYHATHAVLHGESVLKYGSIIGFSDLFGSCTLKWDESKLNALIKNHVYPSKNIANTHYAGSGVAGNEPIKDFAKNKACGIEINGSEKYGITYSTNGTSLSLLRGAVLFGGIEGATVNFTDTIPDSAGYPYIEAPPISCCGPGYNKIIDGWTNNLVLPIHQYPFAVKNDDGEWVVKCGTVCEGAQVLLRDVGPSDRPKSECIYREGDTHPSWKKVNKYVQDNCPKDISGGSTHQDCYQTAYYESSGDAWGTFNIDGWDYFPYFGTGYCYDGHMEVLVYCPDND